MKETIARWLVSIAKKLSPQKDVEEKDFYEAKQIGVCYHIAKADVKKYRGMHPEIKSYREGLSKLIVETKDIVLGSIAAGLKQKKVVEYEVKKTMWTADVTGILNVYVKRNSHEDNKEM